jgi:integrase/recombinase XerD
MRPFESNLSDLMEAFIAYRVSLGYSRTHLRTYLRHLDRYVMAHPGEEMTPLYFLKFKTALLYAPKTVNGIVSTARAFFDYLQRLEIVPENPLTDIPRNRPETFIPYIFSEKETEALLATAKGRIRRTGDHFFTDLKRYMILLLLARCGLRISEPLRLSVDDYCREEGTIHIRKTKFKKSRIIPLPRSLVTAMDGYLSVRKQLGPNGPILFPGERCKNVSAQIVRSFFNRSLGPHPPERRLGSIRFGKPTPHSLRHSFAVNTLKAIRDRGGSPRHALPILSVYMGHSHYTYTAVYLKVLDADNRNALFALARKALL